MPVTLDATPGGSNANAFADVAWADDYHASRPNSDTWTNASTTDKTAALIQSTRFMCRAFIWTGLVATNTQRLCWPRTGMLDGNDRPLDPTVIPAELKDASSEFARQLIEGDRAADNDAARLGISSVRAGAVSVSFRNQNANPSTQQINDQLQLQGPDGSWASRLIPDAVIALLVDSWYARPLIGRPLIFKTS